MSGVSYYELLGLNSTATDNEIRRAYRRLSLQWHPDKRREVKPGADDIFRLIQEAYETLSCPEKRLLYDFAGAFVALADVASNPSPMSAAAPIAAQAPQQPPAGPYGFSSSWNGSWEDFSPSAHAPSPSLSASLSSSCPSTDFTCFSSSPCPNPAARVIDPRSSSPEALRHGNAGRRIPVPPPRHGPSASISASISISASPPTLGGLEGTSPETNSPGLISPGSMLGKRRAPGDTPLAPPDPPQPQPSPLLHPLQSAHPSQPQPQPLPPPQQQPCARVGANGGGGGGGGGGCTNATSGGADACGSRPVATHSADVYHRLLLTLEEMYSGCVKQFKLARRVYGRTAAPAEGPHGPCGDAVVAAAGGVCCRVEELFRVVVQPGWREGTRVTFPGKGDELPCGSRGDMVLVVAQAAHATFTRRGNDLHAVVAVPLLDALTGGAAALTALDGRRLELRLGPACLQPFSERVLKGEGMPIPPGSRARRQTQQGQGKQADADAAGVSPLRGDLLVRFEVAFPQDLTAGQKEELRRALPG